MEGLLRLSPFLKGFLPLALYFERDELLPGPVDFLPPERSFGFSPDDALAFRALGFLLPQLPFLWVERPLRGE